MIKYRDLSGWLQFAAICAWTFGVAVVIEMIIAFLAW